MWLATISSTMEEMRQMIMVAPYEGAKSRAAEAFAAQNYAEAIALYGEVAEAPPADAAWPDIEALALASRSNRALCFLKKGDHAAAVAEVDAALALPGYCAAGNALVSKLLLRKSTALRFLHTTAGDETEEWDQRAQAQAVSAAALRANASDIRRRGLLAPPPKGKDTKAAKAIRRSLEEELENVGAMLPDDAADVDVDAALAAAADAPPPPPPPSSSSAALAPKLGVYQVIALILQFFREGPDPAQAEFASTDLCVDYLRNVLANDRMEPPHVAAVDEGGGKGNLMWALAKGFGMSYNRGGDGTWDPADEREGWRLEMFLGVLALLVDELGAPVDQRGEAGRSPLAIVLRTGCAAAAKALLDRGARPDLRDAEGWLPLHSVCMGDDDADGRDRSEELDAERVATAKLLLEAGADVNGQSLTGCTALMCCCASVPGAAAPHTPLVRLLVNEYAARVDLATGEDQTPAKALEAIVSGKEGTVAYSKYQVAEARTCLDVVSSAKPSAPDDGAVEETECT